jgi:trk system potassium uptake protein TrkH
VAFDRAMVLTVAALSTTGPVAGVVLEDPVSWTEAGAAGQVLLALAMALGRLETLAIVALLNPEFWRS